MLENIHENVMIFHANFMDLLSSSVSLDNADNALQNYLDNDSYHNKIMMGYYNYTYILDFCNSEIALFTNICDCLSENQPSSHFQICHFSAL